MNIKIENTKLVVRFGETTCNELYDTLSPLVTNMLAKRILTRIVETKRHNRIWHFSKYEALYVALMMESEADRIAEALCPASGRAFERAANRLKVEALKL